MPAQTNALRSNTLTALVLTTVSALLPAGSVRAVMLPNPEPPRHMAAAWIAQASGVQIRPSQGFAGQNSGAFPNFFDTLGSTFPIPSLTPFSSTDPSSEEEEKKKKEQEEAAQQGQPSAGAGDIRP